MQGIKVKISVSCLRNSTLDPVFRHTCTDLCCNLIPLMYIVISRTRNPLFRSHYKALVLNQDHDLRRSDLI
jgi:hypothetical protein